MDGMWTNASRAVRVLRRRRSWTQAQLGARAGLSREAISRIERGAISGMTIAVIDRVVSALGASAALQIRWQGEQLDRLLDSAHASLQQSVAVLLRSLGWDVRVEVSFNHFGDRGRVDLIAYHAALRVVLVIEIKSALGDLQDTIGRLDVKARLGRDIARELGYGAATIVIPVLVIGDSRSARRTVTDHGALFARYGLRGRLALAWLRQPHAPMPTGLLWFATRPDSHHVPGLDPTGPARFTWGVNRDGSRGCWRATERSASRACTLGVNPNARKPLRREPGLGRHRVHTWCESSRWTACCTRGIRYDAFRVTSA